MNVRAFALTVIALAGGTPTLAADKAQMSYGTPALGGEFDWQRAYIGAALGYAPTIGAITAEVNIGYNYMATDLLLVGVEGTLGYWLTKGIDTGVRAKAGVAIDSLALYGLAGLGLRDFSKASWSLGVGGEYGISSVTTVGLEVGATGPLLGGIETTRGALALRYHF